jgi:hypothetical protein
MQLTHWLKLRQPNRHRENKGSPPPLRRKTKSK